MIHRKFDPDSLNLNVRPPAPVRLSKDDWELVHRSRLGRMRVHGNASLLREENYLEHDAPLRGISGNYIVTLGPRSHAENGHDSSLPVLEASVGAFSRM